jgi:hypothetical protein
MECFQLWNFRLMTRLDNEITTNAKAHLVIRFHNDALNPLYLQEPLFVLFASFSVSVLAAGFEPLILEL